MDDFQKVKAGLDLLDVITRETSLVMKGKHLEQCPFCNGHNCFSIFSNGESYKCHQCSESGDVIEFLEKYRKTDKANALKLGADLAGIKLERKGNGNAAVNMSVKHRIFLAAATHYAGHLKVNGGADHLTKKRGHQMTTIEGMNVGWTSGKLIEHLKAKGFSLDDLVQSGLVSEKKNNDGEVTGHRDFFPAGVAIFPHEVKGKVGHFTIKDPKKQINYQLPNTAKDAGWKFYNQEALKSKEIILVEGEHDLLSLVDAGYKNAIAIIGQISDKQLKALATDLKSKRLYLWVDKDEAGNNYIRKITTRLKGENYDVRIVEHPGEFKDADEYLRAVDGDLRKEVRKLLDNAVPYLGWEIKRIAEVPTADERLKQLRAHNIFSLISLLVEAEREVYMEKLIGLGFSRKAMDQQIDNNQELKEKLGNYYTSIPEKEWNPLTIAKIVFVYFNEFGRFFHNGHDSTYLLYHHNIFKVGDNLQFNALMMKYTRMLPNRSPGAQVWKALENYAYNNGLQIDLASWIHVSRATDSIYVNLNSPGNGILKISPGKVEEIENGLNNEGVLLNSSNKIMPFTFLPDVDVREGMGMIGKLIVNNLTCEEEQRHLILCWLFTAFMIDFAPHMALMKFSGASSSGKTTAAKLLSLLLYGTEQIIDPSGAAAFTISAQNPLLIIDNLEQENITKQIGQFLLLSSTKGSKEKRRAGTETETTHERPKSLVLITAIEPFTKAELINRTYDIDFSHKYHTDGFIEDEIIGEIMRNRDMMLSAMLKLIAMDILPNLKDRRDLLTVLKKQYSKHSKTRTNEYLALMMLILQKVLAHVPVYGEGDFLTGSDEAKNVWHKWIEYQDNKAKETETGSNVIIKLLDGIAHEFLKTFRKQSADEYKDVALFQPILKEDGVVDKVKVHENTDMGLTAYISEEIQVKSDNTNYAEASLFFMATAKEMVYALDVHCRDMRLKNPFSTASIFSARLRNDTNVMKADGWTLVSKAGIEPHIKIVNGKRSYMFRKRVTR